MWVGCYKALIVSIFAASGQSATHVWPNKKPPLLSEEVFCFGVRWDYFLAMLVRMSVSAWMFLNL